MNLLLNEVNISLVNIGYDVESIINVAIYLGIGMM